MYVPKMLTNRPIRVTKLYRSVSLILFLNTEYAPKGLLMTIYIISNINIK